jgi:hypothetical protein
MNPNRGLVLLNVYCSKWTASLTAEQLQTEGNSGQGGPCRRRDIDQYGEDITVSVQSDEQRPEWLDPAQYEAREVIEEPQNGNDRVDEEADE